MTTPSFVQRLARLVTLSAIRQIYLVSILFVLFGSVLLAFHSPTFLSDSHPHFSQLISILALPIVLHFIMRIGQSSSPTKQANAFLRTDDMGTLSHHAHDAIGQKTRLSELVQDAKRQCSGQLALYPGELEKLIFLSSIVLKMLSDKFSHNKDKKSALYVDEIDFHLLFPFIISGTPENTERMGYPHSREIDIINAKNSAIKIVNEFHDTDVFYDIPYLFISSIPQDAFMSVNGLRIHKLVVENPCLAFYQLQVVGLVK